MEIEKTMPGFIEAEGVERGIIRIEFDSKEKGVKIFDSETGADLRAGVKSINMVIDYSGVSKCSLEIKPEIAFSGLFKDVEKVELTPVKEKKENERN